VVDDEQLARKLLEGYIHRLPSLRLVKSCKNAIEAMECVQDNDIDLIFLDIQMPELTGIGFLQTIFRKPVVIFTTAYKEYAIQGYQLDVVDYLLKPFTFERFLQGVNKAVELIKAKSLSANTPVKEPDEAGNENKDFIALKADYRTYRVPYDKIIYVEGAREYVIFYTEERKIMVLESLRHLEEILPSPDFLRIHKSYIINKKKVRALYGNQVEIADKQIPIGKSYLEIAKNSLF
jgi:DNA-binding LytR/AlgR family response regulator